MTDNLEALTPQRAAYLEKQRQAAIPPVDFNSSDEGVSELPAAETIPEPAQYVSTEVLKRLGKGSSDVLHILDKPHTQTALDGAVADIVDCGSNKTVVYNISNGVTDVGQGALIVFDSTNLPGEYLVPAMDYDGVVNRLHLIGNAFRVDYYSDEEGSFTVTCRWPKVAAEIERLIALYQPDDGYTRVEYIVHVIEAMRHLQNRYDLLPAAAGSKLQPLISRMILRQNIASTLDAVTNRSADEFFPYVEYTYNADARLGDCTLKCGNVELYFMLNTAEREVYDIHITDPERHPMVGYGFGRTGDHIWRCSEAYFLKQLGALTKALEEI